MRHRCEARLLRFTTRSNAVHKPRARVRGRRDGVGADLGLERGGEVVVLALLVPPGDLDCDAAERAEGGRGSVVVSVCCGQQWQWRGGGGGGATRRAGAERAACDTGWRCECVKTVVLAQVRAAWISALGDIVVVGALQLQHSVVCSHGADERLGAGDIFSCRKRGSGVTQNREWMRA